MEFPSIYTTVCLFLLSLSARHHTSSSLPHLFVYDGIGGPSYASPGNGVPGTFGGLANAAHDSCSSTSNCAVSLQDARITSAPIVQRGQDGHLYLMTSFHAG